MEKEKKVVLMSRVSTGLQDLDSQHDKLVEAAHAEGFTDSQFIIIKDVESAVKLKEEERNGIIKLKDAVLNQGAKHIIVFELSRLSRRPDTIYSVRNFLIEHKVQLQVLNPAFKMLKPDGTMDENANILIGIFNSLAENEGLLRRARFARGKAKLAAQNKAFNGESPYGYRVDENLDYIINDDEAEIVKKIFLDYVNNGKTTADIARELISTGIRNSTFGSAKNFVLSVLHNCGYCGRNTAERKYGYKPKLSVTMPAIISEDLFDAAESTFTKRKKYNKTKSKNIYLCRGILVNKFGHPLTVKTNSGCYVRQEFEQDVISSISIRTDFIDAVTWFLTKQSRLSRPNNGKEIFTGKLAASIKQLELEQASIDGEIAELKAKVKRIELRFIQGKLEDWEADEMEEPVKREILSKTSVKASISARIEALTSQLNNLLSGGSELTEDELDALSKEEQYQIVKEEIKCIMITRPEINKADALIGVSTNIADDPVIYKLNTKTRSLYLGNNLIFKHK